MSDLYGLKEDSMPNTSHLFNPTDPQLTPADLDKMRAIVLQADRREAHKVTDLSRPPVVPYVYREFPKLVYLHSSNKPAHQRIIKNQLGQEQTDHVPWKCETRTVNNAQELDAALKEGWSEKAPEQRYDGQNQQVEDDAIGTAEFMKSLPLPDFTSWTKERLLAYALAMYELRIAPATSKDDIIGQIEDAALAKV